MAKTEYMLQLEQLYGIRFEDEANITAVLESENRVDFLDLRYWVPTIPPLYGDKSNGGA